MEKTAMSFRIRNPLAARAPVLVPRQLMYVIKASPKKATIFDNGRDIQAIGSTARQKWSENTIAVIAIAEGFDITTQIQVNTNPRKSP
jgi:hypothetical protein